ncbi:MAG: ECF transporter S component [Oscillospiraceae bacterium]
MKTKTKSTQQKTQVIVFAGLFSAIAVVLYLLEFPVVPGVSHLKLDLSDIPALVGAVFFGPAFGVVVELIKNIIELLIKGIGTQMGFGNIMNFLVGCAYVVPFSIIFRKLFTKDGEKKWKSIVIPSAAGIACILVVGVAANYIIAPLFFKYFMGVEFTSKVLWAAIWGATALNAIKGVMLSIVIYPLTMLFSTRMSSIFKIQSPDKSENSTSDIA